MSEAKAEGGQEFAIEYARVQRLAEYVAHDILRCLRDALRELGDPHLIRAIVESWRIKPGASVIRMAAQQGWKSPAQALIKAQDILGFRVVCNNLQDVERVAVLVRESLAQEGLTVRKHDYVGRPKPDGYRAIHLTFRYPTKMGVAAAELGCEIQIRSLLQNSWAQLSRADLYATPADVPVSIIKKMQRLAAQLGQADAIADGIRNQLARPRRGRKPRDQEPFSASALAFVYRQRYIADPPDYLMQAILKEYGSTGVRADGLDAALRDEEFQKVLRETYGACTKWEADNEQLFRWSAHAVVYGKDSALRLARRSGREEWREIVRIARNEAMASTQTRARY